MVRSITILSVRQNKDFQEIISVTDGEDWILFVRVDTKKEGAKAIN